MPFKEIIFIRYTVSGKIELLIVEQNSTEKKLTFDKSSLDKSKGIMKLYFNSTSTVQSISAKNMFRFRGKTVFSSKDDFKNKVKKIYIYVNKQKKDEVEDDGFVIEDSEVPPMTSIDSIVHQGVS